MAEEFCGRCDSPLGDFEDEPTVTLRGRQYHALCGLSEAASLLNASLSTSLDDYRDALEILGCATEVTVNRYNQACAEARRDELVAVARDIFSGVKP